MLKKTLHCPYCKHAIRVQAEMLAPVGQYLGDPKYATGITCACEKCFKTFTFNGDPKSTSTMPYEPPKP